MDAILDQALAINVPGDSKAMAMFRVARQTVMLRDPLLGTIAARYPLVELPSTPGSAVFSFDGNRIAFNEQYATGARDVARLIELTMMIAISDGTIPSSVVETARAAVEGKL